MPEYAAIIFDVDGLIVDSEELYSRTYIETLADFGKTLVKENYTACVGIPVEENAAHAVEHFNLSTTPEAYCEAWMGRFEAAISVPGGIDLMPGILDLLEHVEGVYELALASSTKQPRMRTTVVNGLMHHLDYHSPEHLFSVILSGSDVVHTKPAPDIYLLAAEKLGVEPSKCLVFEDSQAGVIAAKSAGMTVWAVPNFFTSHQDHSQADRILDSLDEAIELLK
jgi:beta-phosphoglucomutase-like phosphatase (HAD superfamily)